MVWAGQGGGGRWVGWGWGKGGGKFLKFSVFPLGGGMRKLAPQCVPNFGAQSRVFIGTFPLSLIPNISFSALALMSWVSSRGSVLQSVPC